MKIKLRCVKIVRDESSCVDCPCNCTHANDEFPELIQEVEDECEHFIVAPNGHFWPDNEFFAMNQLMALEVDHTGLLPGNRSLQFWDPVLAEPPEPGNLFPKGN